MRQCAAAGYPVRVVVMPIILIAGWRDAYGAFLQELITTVSLARITRGGICSYDGALALTEAKLGSDQMSGMLTRPTLLQASRLVAGCCRGCVPGWTSENV